MAFFLLSGQSLALEMQTLTAAGDTHAAR